MLCNRFMGETLGHT